jgi:hypothetical protein
MLRVRRLMPKEIPVRPCVKKPLIYVAFSLPDGKRDRHIGKTLTDRVDDLTEVIVRKSRILPALEDKRAEAEIISLFTAFEDLIIREAVPVKLPVVPADAAVPAVIPAIICKFDEPAEINIVAVNGIRPDPRRAPELIAFISCHRAAASQKSQELIISEVALCIQFLDQFRHFTHQMILR